MVFLRLLVRLEPVAAAGVPARPSSSSERKERKRTSTTEPADAAASNPSARCLGRSSS